MGEESFVANLEVFVKSIGTLFQHYNILVNLVILMVGFHNFIIAKIAGKKLCDHSNFVKTTLHVKENMPR